MTGSGSFPEISCSISNAESFSSFKKATLKTRRKIASVERFSVNALGSNLQQFSCFNVGLQSFTVARCTIMFIVQEANPLASLFKHSHKFAERSIK
jgi:hypothetical protein